MSLLKDCMPTKVKFLISWHHKQIIGLFKAGILTEVVFESGRSDTWARLSNGHETAPSATA